MLLNEGQKITGSRGSYQVQAKIGSESTFGAVFKVLNDAGDPMVIKQLLGPSQIGADLGMDYTYVRATFEREAKILIAHNHPQIVAGHDFFERDDDLFLVMEFINGEDLDQVLIRHMDENNGLPFSQDQVLPIGVELCRVIHAVHQLPGQVLYRDLKPRNVMWDAANRALKLIDFGTARFMQDGRKATEALGTPGYAPPEFYSKSSTLSFASDVYTIGATLFELLTGEVPEALMTPVSWHGQEAGIADGLRAVIVKAMDQEPGRRYQTAQEMGLALEALAGDLGPVQLQGKLTNPYPYLSCFCQGCGAQPKNEQSVFCTECGGAIHVMMLRIAPANSGRPSMDLFLDKRQNLIGRQDMDSGVYPDVDLSRYDPDCYVSRKHCMLKRDGVRFFIEPLNTTNPTLINDYQATPGRTVEISDGVVIALADLNITFTVKPVKA